ncbi:MAG: glutathione S-transferase family protein [Pseudomonadota bacterium]
MKLFGHPDSGHAFKVRLMLRVADIAHDYECIDIFAPRESRPAEFRHHATWGEVPLLLDDGIAYAQSNAILVHLAQRCGGWGAQDPRTLQQCLEWLMWEANKIGMCLPQLRADKLFSDSRLAPAARDYLLARYQSDVATLSDRLTDTGAFILGSAPTIADFSICGYLVHAQDADVDVPAAVERWLARIRDLSGWQPPQQLLAV